MFSLVTLTKPVDFFGFEHFWKHLDLCKDTIQQKDIFKLGLVRL